MGASVSIPASVCRARPPSKPSWPFPFVPHRVLPTAPWVSPNKSCSAPLPSSRGLEHWGAIGPLCLSSGFISALPLVLSLYPSIPSLPIKVSSCLLNSLYHLLLWPHLATYPCVYYLRWNSSGYIPGFTLNCLIFRMVSVGLGCGFGFFFKLITVVTRSSVSLGSFVSPGLTIAKRILMNLLLDLPKYCSWVFLSISVILNCTHCL